jgi:hypothetical protein
VRKGTFHMLSVIRLCSFAALVCAPSACCEDEHPPVRDAGPDADAAQVVDAGACGGACATSQLCVDDIVCKYMCTTDEDCLRIDARIGQCGPLGLCQGPKN